MKSRLLAVSAAAALLIAAAAPAFAASVSVGGDTGVNVSTGASTTSGVSTGVTTGTSGSVGASTGVGVTGSASGQTGSSSMSGSTNGSGSVDMGVGSTGVSMNGTAGATISLTSTNPAVMNYSGTTTPTISDATSVQTQDQLDAFATGIMHSDANIQTANISTTDVSLTYKKTGHLFGFIPVSITEQGDVKSDGTVSLSYPWYHFLVSTGDSADTQANLQTEVQPLVSANANGSFSAQTQAQIVADLYAAMKGNS